MSRPACLPALLAASLSLVLVTPLLANPQALSLNRIGGYDTGLGEGASEIVAYDAATQRAFVVNAVAATVDIVDLSNPAAPALLDTIDVTGFGAVANSVAVNGGRLAIAVEAAPKTDPGTLVFTDLDGQLLGSVATGALPDMVSFTPDGRYALVANEGEPNDDYDVDPEGSISIVDLSAGIAGAVVRTAGFTDFNVGGPRAAELPAGVRIYGPGATVAQDLEPEYIAAGNEVAFVSLQEANAIARVDIVNARIDAIFALGTKDHSLPGQGLDPSDRDAGIAIGNWPVHGMFQPDGIALYEQNGVPYILTANEGDTRDYDGFGEESRVSGLTLDPTAFPNAATLQQNAQLGRLTVTTVDGDVGNDNDYDAIFVPGGRSFSVIRGSDGQRVFDSGDDFEQITALLAPTLFNSQGDAGSFDGRSDNKGPEPESVVVGRVGGRDFGFIGLERIGGFFVYDLNDPMAPEFVHYTTGQGGDLAPEGLAFVPAEQSPNGRPLLLAAHEVSGTLGVYQIDGCVISRIDASSDQVTIFGYCPGGFDLYRDGVLVQAGVTVNGFVRVVAAGMPGQRYFAALPGEMEAINGVFGTVAPREIPLLSPLALLGLLILLAGLGSVQLAAARR